MFIWLNWLMSNCDCILVKTIQLYMIWCIAFLFAIDMVVDELIVSFFIPLKDNDYCVRIWLTLLSRKILRYLFSSYKRAKDDFLSVFNICCQRQEKNVFWILFCGQTSMTVMTLFKNVLQIVWLYLSMWVQLKLVGSDKLLESVLSMMNIPVTANLRQYL